MIEISYEQGSPGGAAMSDLASQNEADAALAQRFQVSLRSFAETHPAAARRGQWCSIDVLVQFGSVPLLLRIRHGAVVEIVDRLPFLCSWNVAIRASASAWRQ